MKTFNIRFRSEDKLRDYLYENEIIDSSDILIQVFSHKKDMNSIKNVTTLLQELLPSASLIGTTTDGEVIEGRILTDNIVISISVFEYSYIKSTVLVSKETSFERGVLLAMNLLKMIQKLSSFLLHLQT